MTNFYRQQLLILQLERYQVIRAWKAFFNKLFSKKFIKSDSRQKINWTTKKKFISLIAMLFSVLLATLALINLPKLIAIALILMLIIFPLISLSIGVLILLPIEGLIRLRAIYQTRNQIKKMSVPVVSITGSYGKTSVKNVLTHLLDSHFKVLATPKSFNTILGLRQVVNLELDQNYDFFIAEIGAFVPGDITRLSFMTNPTYGVLTGITEQHLERFGNLGNIIKTKFELPEYIEKNPESIACYFNGADEIIVNEFNKRSLSKSKLVRNTDIFKFEVTGFNKDKLVTEIQFNWQGRKNNTETKLIGQAHMDNIKMSSYVALQLGLPIEKLDQAIKSLPQIKARSELLKINNFTVINNGYSSNKISFKSSLETLADLPFKNKILVTPGIVELGNETKLVHKHLSKLIADSSVTHTILVKESDRTESLKKFLNQSYDLVENIDQVWELINKRDYSPDDTVILFENDLPDNY